MTGRLLVAVVDYRSAEAVGRLVASLDGEGVDLLVAVENGSGGDEVDQLERALGGRPWTRLLPLAQNLGFGAGVNRAVAGLEPRPADVVWVLNPDMEVEPGAAARLRAALDEGYDVVSPLITTGAAGRAVWFAGGDVDRRHGRTAHAHWGEEASALVPDLRPTGFLSGAAPMFRAEAWSRLDGYREDLFLYWEDADLSLRARALGLRLGVERRALLWHEEGGSSAGEGRGATFYFHMQRNRLRVLAPASGRAKAELLLGAGAVETLKLLLRPLLREREARVAKLRASAAGLRAGLRGS